jgi:hypothetical protein
LAFAALTNPTSDKVFHPAPADVAVSDCDGLSLIGAVPADTESQPASEANSAKTPLMTRMVRITLSSWIGM